MQMASFYAPLWFVNLLTLFIYAYTCIRVYKLYGIVRESLKASEGLIQDSNRNEHEQHGNHTFVAAIVGDVVISGKEPTRLLLHFNREIRIYSKLILWPAIFLAVRIIPTVNRIQRMITGEYVFILFFFHSLTTSIHGFFNALVYVINPLDHIVLLRNIVCFPCDMYKKAKKNKQQRSMAAHEIEKIEEHNDA